MSNKIFMTQNFINNVSKHGYKNKILKNIIFIYNFANYYSNGKIKKLNSKVKIKDKSANLYRFKSGNFRIIFSLEKSNTETEIILIDFNSRASIYKNLENKKKIILNILPDDPILYYNNFKNKKEKLVEHNISLEQFEKKFSEQYISLNTSRKYFVEDEYLKSEEKFVDFINNKYFKYLKLDIEQEKVLNKNIPAKLIRGKPGTGKTILLMRDLIRYYTETDRSIVVTFNPKVSFILRYFTKKFINEEIYEKKIKINSFDEFIDEVILGKFLDIQISFNIKSKYINEVEIENIIKKIIDKNLNFKNFDSKEVLKYIRSFYKGNTKCFDIKNLPDKLSEDIKKNILKYYNLFKKYEKYLKEKNIKDIYDVYLEIYNHLVSNVYKINSRNKKIYSIYIDEIQDFTPLEREIIFKVLSTNNKNKVFITADNNQQISLLGFEWDSIINEITQIFKDINLNLNLLIELKKNFRSTKQINDFADIFINEKGKIESVFSDENLKPIIIIYKNDDEYKKIINKILKLKNIMIIYFKDNNNYLFNKENKDNIIIEDLIFHYKESKGLENNIVFLIDPFSMIHSPNYKEILFMASSRARRYLYILTSKDDYNKFYNEFIRNKGKNKDKYQIITDFNEEHYKQIEENSKMIDDDIFLKILKIESYFRQYEKFPKKVIKYLEELQAWEYIYILYERDKTLHNLKKQAELQLYKLKNYHKAASIYINDLKNPEEGAKIYYEYIKDTERALKICENYGLYDYFIEICNKEIDNSLLENDKEKEYYYKNILADFYFKSKKYSIAKDIYDSINDNKNYIECCIKLKEYEKAIERYKILSIENKYLKIGIIYEKYLNQPDKAKKFYLQGKNYTQYINLCLKNKDYSELIDFYIEQKNYFEVANIYKNYLKDYFKAVDFYIKIYAFKSYSQKKFIKSNNISLEDILNNLDSIIEKSSEKNKISSYIADKFYELKEYEIAIEYYYKAKNYNKIFNFLEYIYENKEKSGFKYSKSKLNEEFFKFYKFLIENNVNDEEIIDRTIRLFLKLKLFDYAFDLLEINKKYYKLFNLFNKYGYYQKALSLYKDKNLKIKKENIDNIINNIEKYKNLLEGLKKEKNFGKIAYIYEVNLDNIKEAINYYEKYYSKRKYSKKNRRYKVIELSLKLSNFEVFDDDTESNKYDYKDEISNYKLLTEYYIFKYTYKKEWYNLAKLYEILNRYENAIDIYYNKLNNYEDTIKCYEKINKFEKIIEIAIESKKFYYVEKYYKNIDNHIQYILNNLNNKNNKYITQKDFLFLAQTYELIGYYQKAADIYFRKLKDYKKSFQLYLKNNNYFNAARISEKYLKNYQDAVLYYKKAEKFKNIIYLSFKLKDFKILESIKDKLNSFNNLIKQELKKALKSKNKDWLFIAKVFELLENYQKAADIYFKELNDYEKSLELYEKINDWNSYNKVLFKMNTEESLIKAAYIYYNKLKNYEKAEELLLNLNKINEITKLYEKDNNYNKLGIFYKNKLKNYKKALFYFEKSNNFIEIIKIYIELKFIKGLKKYKNILIENKKLFSNFIKKNLNNNNNNNNDYSFLGVLYELLEDYNIAAEYYLKANNIEKAIKLFNRVGNYNEILKIYLKRNDYNEAINFCVSHVNYFANQKHALTNIINGFLSYNKELTEKDYLKIAKLYELLEDYSNAADYYLKANNIKKALKFYLKSENFYKCVQIYLKQNNYRKALDICIQNNSYFLKRKEIIKELLNHSLKNERSFTELDYYKVAKLSEMIEDFENACKFFVESGFISKAIEMYEKIKSKEDNNKIIIYENQLLNRAILNILNKKYFKALELYRIIDDKKKLELTLYLIEKQKNISEKLAHKYASSQKFLKAGRIYYELKNYKLAARMFKKANDITMYKLSLKKMEELNKKRNDYIKSNIIST